jgi:hypothetical protein
MLTSTWNEPAALTHRDHNQHQVFFRLKPLRGITGTVRGLQIQYIQMRIICSSQKGSRNSLVQFTVIATANKVMYTDVLRRLRDAVARKCPEKVSTNSWFLLHNNVPAHRSVLVMDFLAANNVTMLEYPPHTHLTWLQLIFTRSLD